MNPIPSTRANRRRPKNTTPERDAQIVRGVLIDRLDGALADIERIAYEELAAEIGDSRELSWVARRAAPRVAIAVIQRVQCRLFPEAFLGPECEPGLVPAGGPARVGADRLRAFVALIAGRE